MVFRPTKAFKLKGGKSKMKVVATKLSIVYISVLFLCVIWTGLSAAKVDLKDAVGIWRFEGKGDVAEDETGNGHDGKIIGAERISGKDGQALEFDGKDDYVEIEPDKNLNPTDKITVVAWVKSTIKGQYNAVWSVVSKYDAYILGPPSAGPQMCFIIHNGAWQYNSCYTPKDVTDWVHYVGTYDSKAKEKHLYANGVLSQTTNTPGAINADAGPIHLGHRECCAGQNHLAALIDEVAIFNVVLDEKQIKEIYDKGLAAAVSYQGKLAAAWGTIKAE